VTFKTPKKLEKPKSKRSAYTFFSAATMKTLKKEMPGLSFGDRSREVARRWNTINSQDQVKYHDTAFSAH
jgi:hypothetical protein